MTCGRSSRATSRPPCSTEDSALSSPAIAFSRVSKRYFEGFEALRDASFTIGSGEFACVTGHSGAGKTTALRLIPVIERASSGSVLVNGQNVGALRPDAVPYLRRNVGLVFQDQKLLHDRNVIENVMLPLVVCGSAPGEAARRARAALDKVGLAGRENSMPIALSGGEQQRLCIARAIANRPSILLADEPTSNLDPGAAADVMAIFKAFNQVGVTVVVATHDAALVARFATRAIHLSHGRVVEARELGAAR
jgi:cell division transport system ATP-binding protein